MTAVAGSAPARPTTRTRLDWEVHPVRGLRWGAAPALADGVLTLDRAALAAHLLEDRRLASVELELAAPGEACRIGPVFDVVEPRAKRDPAIPDFPGAIGPVAAVGYGATAVLRGAAVTLVDPGPHGPYRSYIDCQGPVDPPRGAARPLSRYSTLHHLVVLPRLAPDLDRPDQRHALRTAALRAAVYLARAAGDAPPDAVESLELTPADPALPRVAYVFQVHSHQRPTLPHEPLLYGDNTHNLLPTIFQPNEVLDGAVLSGYGSLKTYEIQNHPVIRELYERHGREVCFAGVVLTVAHNTVPERDRAVLIAANLVAHTLRADGVVLTKSGGGAPHVDMAQLGRACEQLGVKTTLVAWDSTSLGSGDDGAALFNYPELNAIVNFGNSDGAVTLPRVERLLTSLPEGPETERLRGPWATTIHSVLGAMDQTGGGHLTAVHY
ncbi:MAG TPA: glycine/sarcosine/betaine reductase component B subunit [Chloroflexota bacterium]|jgi:glycine reductase